MFSGGKMEEGWDLNAVVRGYVGTGKGKTTVDSSTNFSFMDLINEIPLDDFGTPIGLPSLFEDNNSNPFDELGNFYKPFYPDPPPLQHVLPASPPSMAAAATLGTVGILNRSLFPQQIQQQALLLQQQKQQQEQQQLLQQGQEQEQQQQQHQRQFLGQQLQHHHPQGPTHYRWRKRKSEQKRTTYQVTAENIISTDHWAWRKYGQKPIKGSPYPRNYYRCSSSKRCTARKQVEKSPTQPNLYLVTYTGDHCHPRPTHRNSLAGSSRTKFYAANKSNYENFETKSEATVSTSSLVPKIATPSPLSPSPSSESSLSPNTPSATTTTELDDVDANNTSNGNNNKGDICNVGVVAVGSEDNFENELEVFVNGATKMEKTCDENSSFRIEYNDVLIPNLMVDEDMLSMKEQGMASVEIVVGSPPGSYGSVNIGGRDVGNSVPPWNPIGCSANAGGAV